MRETYTLEDALRDLGLAEIPAGAAALPLAGVAIDSRAVRPGDLFVALPGERTDGHAYVGAALAAGAVAALVSHPTGHGALVDLTSGQAPGAVDASVEVRVPDTLAALQRLAGARRRAHRGLRVVGITGSVGKTTTKEAVAGVLARHYATLKSEGNRNNEIGLPLTLMRLRPTHEVTVLEMGMYDLGEIAALCEIAAPQVGVVTNVGPVHLERLGTMERIAQAKQELLDALPAGGVAVLNGDDPLVMAMATPLGVQRLTYGLGEGCQVRGLDVAPEGLDGVRLTLEVHAPALGLPSVRRSLWVPMPGAHSALAALAAVAVGLLFGMPMDEVAEGLAGLTSGLRLVPKPAVGGATLLDDTYNASPASTLAALDLLRELAGRRIAVLGDMLELGDYEERGHREVGRRAAGAVDLLVTVGRRARWIAEEALAAGLAPAALMAFDEQGEATRWLAAEARAGDVILVKASRSMGLEAMVKALEEAA